MFRILVLLLSTALIPTLGYYMRTKIDKNDAKTFWNFVNGSTSTVRTYFRELNNIYHYEDNIVISTVFYGELNSRSVKRPYQLTLLHTLHKQGNKNIPDKTTKSSAVSKKKKFCSDRRCGQYKGVDLQTEFNNLMKAVAKQFKIDLPLQFSVENINVVVLRMNDQQFGNKIDFATKYFIKKPSDPEPNHDFVLSTTSVKLSHSVHLEITNDKGESEIETTKASSDFGKSTTTQENSQSDRIQAIFDTETDEITVV